MTQEHGDHRLYVAVDADSCCGNALCAEIAPEVFKLDDGGLAYVEANVVPPGLEDQVREAARACPVAAIVVDENRPA